MTKEDKITILSFVLLIILILIVIGINILRNNRINNKTINNNILGIYDSETIIQNGKELFLNAIHLLNPNKAFEVSEKTYKIKKKSNYKKIKNIDILFNTLRSDDINYYLDKYKILLYKNNYYINKINMENNNYVGSIINLYSYNNNEVIFESVNYFCDNYKFVGLLENEPNCTYKKEETLFSTILEDDILKIKKFIEIEEIIK